MRTNSLVLPKELEKYLILNSNRLRTFEDARLEIGEVSMTQDLEDTLIPWILMRSSLFHPAKQKVLGHLFVSVTTQDRTHCRSSWKGITQTSSDDACSGCQVHHGSPQRME